MFLDPCLLVRYAFSVRGAPIAFGKGILSGSTRTPLAGQRTSRDRYCSCSQRLLSFALFALEQQLDVAA
jgi:hypothetical protein